MKCNEAKVEEEDNFGGDDGEEFVQFLGWAACAAVAAAAPWGEYM